MKTMRQRLFDGASWAEIIIGGLIMAAPFWVLFASL